MANPYRSRLLHSHLHLLRFKLRLRYLSRTVLLAILHTQISFPWSQRRSNRPHWDSSSQSYDYFCPIRLELEQGIFSTNRHACRSLTLLFGKHPCQLWYEVMAFHSLSGYYPWAGYMYELYPCRHCSTGLVRLMAWCSNGYCTIGHRRWWRFLGSYFAYVEREYWVQRYTT